jgi:hypothetical protein
VSKRRNRDRHSQSRKRIGSKTDTLVTTLEREILVVEVIRPSKENDKNKIDKDSKKLKRTMKDMLDGLRSSIPNSQIMVVGLMIVGEKTNFDIFTNDVIL